MNDSPIRIGVLGCATVTDYAILQPAKSTGAIEVAAVASRSSERANAYARQHNIAAAFASYEALLEQAEVDAIYVPLPNALHREWTIAALRAGFPVLCEKPVAANSAQAAEMVKVAQEENRLLVEAFHWRHHPLAKRMIDLINTGTIGALYRIECFFDVPTRYLLPNDFRLNPSLGAGVTMDQGGYCINLMRLVAGTEPTVRAAQAKLIAPNLDGTMVAELDFPNGISGKLSCCMTSQAESLSCGVTIIGELGTITIQNPFLPGFGGESKITVSAKEGNSEEFPTAEPSYNFQARAFAQSLRSDVIDFSNALDGIANMRVIDEIYLAAGLMPRS